MKKIKLLVASLALIACCVPLIHLTTVRILALGKPHQRMTIKPGSSIADTTGLVRGNLGSALDQYMKRLEGYGFSGSLLVAKNNTIYLTKGYGWADREHLVPVTDDSIFYVASITKQFTAAAIMKLEQQGKLRVEDAISKYFDNVPEDKKSITLHHLLTHSSGFPNEFSRPGADYAKNPNGFYYTDRDEYVRAILASPLEYPPGSRTEYSNAGFSLIAAIIEKVSGQTYQSYVKEQLLTPAGLTSTGFDGDRKKWAASRVARGFDGSVEMARDSQEYWGTLGAEGILSSVRDLYKWEQALRGDKILTSIEKKKMFGARVPSGGFFDYAYGWRFQKSPRGTDIFWASGLEPTWSAMFQMYVDEDVTIIFLTNNSLDGFPFRDVLVIPGREAAIERIVFGKEYALPPWFVESKTGVLQKYAGTYKTASGAEFVVSVDRNALRVAPRSQSAADLLIPPVTDTPASDYSKYHAQILKGLESYTGGQKKSAYEQIRFDGESLEKQFGRFLGVERLITLPVFRNKGTHRATTYAELKFERGIVSYRWHWSDGELSEQQKPKLGQQLAILPPFREQSPKEFVAYHIILGRSLRVSFEFGDNGKVQSMKLGVQNSEVKAVKL